MGMLTDYFAATPEQAMGCAEHGPVETTLPQAKLTWMMPRGLLGRLWAHTAGADYDVDRFDAEAEEVARQDEFEGPWLMRIKDRCTDSLAGIREDQILPLATLWSQAEEWIGHPEPSELAFTVRELATVARAAMVPERNLYVWMCL